MAKGGGPLGLDNLKDKIIQKYAYPQSRDPPQPPFGLQT